MGIGAKLKDVIKDRNTNVNEVAKRANVMPSVLYSIIKRDSKSVDINVLITVANILGVPVEYFGDNYKHEDNSDDHLAQNEKDLLTDFRLLNPVGQNRGSDYIHDLTKITEYTTPPEPEAEPAAKKDAASSSA
ncbi:MAG: helix-turn-helix transcriptional regulator [Acidaminococcaceae bacterium]|nr:helix-turn-helix transcriptional regulator [Acidaminococcaceae bacterium]